MNKTVMILGAAGNFGSRIAMSLAEADIPLIISDLNQGALQKLVTKIQIINIQAKVDLIVFNIYENLPDHLKRLKPVIVINTCGPFQTAGYSIATECTNSGIHYIDLADSRKYIASFSTVLDNLAKKNNCLAVTGASTVPCLSSAVLDHYKAQFKNLDSLVFGITPGQKTVRGLATTKAILSYVGKEITPHHEFKNKSQLASLNCRKNSFVSSLKDNAIYGWQDLYLQNYPTIGKRWMANCEIADLDLLPLYYNLQSIRFSAGIESAILHLGLWCLSWLVRIGLIKNLMNYAQPILKLSHLFDYFGSDDGGMHMIISGRDKNNNPKTIKWFIIAKNGHGPHIPTIPAIILTKKLIDTKLAVKGAMPCINLISLEEYLAELKNYNITTYENIS